MRRPNLKRRLLEMEELEMLLGEGHPTMIPDDLGAGKCKCAMHKKNNQWCYRAPHDPEPKCYDTREDAELLRCGDPYCLDCC